MRKTRNSFSLTRGHATTDHKSDIEFHCLLTFQDELWHTINFIFALQLFTLLPTIHKTLSLRIRHATQAGNERSQMLKKDH